MHAAAPIFLSAMMWLTLASLLVLGVILVRRSAPSKPAKVPLARQPVVITSVPAWRPDPALPAGLRLRAPPTFRSHSGELIPAVRARSGVAALTPSPAVPNPH